MIHLCTETPCPQQDKEALDMLNNSFTATYTMTQKEIIADHERRLKALEEVVEALTLRSVNLQPTKIVHQPIKCCGAYGAQGHQSGCVNYIHNF